MLVAERLNLSESTVEGLTDSLFEARLLLEHQEVSNNPKIRWFRQTSNSWGRWGWGEAAEYHLSTYDYPFITSDEIGLRVARERMSEYSKTEPDFNRYKRYPTSPTVVALPKPSENSLTAPLNQLSGPSSKNRPGKIDLKVLGAALSMTFGQVAQIKPTWDAAPIVLRSSPSGGGRHPTESYLTALDVRGLRPGWYHVGVNPPQLELLPEGRTDTQHLRKLFPAMFERVGFKISAIVTLTSMFERNMYRYREPRTFRTVHMDAGHLASTLEMAARSLGVKAFVLYGGNDIEIEREIGINGLVEGYMLSLALG